MLLTVSTTHRPATDLGYLLHKHPDRAQSFTTSSGVAHVFYPKAANDECTVALLLEVDHPAYGPLTLAGSPIRFEENPYSGGRADHRPPPLLDEHGDAIRAWATAD